MDITTYLRRTIPDVGDPDLTAEEPLLTWMTQSLSELSLQAPIEVVPVSTSDVSHKYVRFSGRHYVVWDSALNGVLLRLLVGMQYDRIANSASDPVEVAACRETAAAIFRLTLFSYLSAKLARFPKTASAFAMLAADEPVGKESFPIPESELIAELAASQRLLMFYHEVTHALHVERSDLRARSVTSLTGLLEELGPLAAEASLGSDFDVAYPEFSELDRGQRFTHFAEELDCDLQAFVFASMAIPNAPTFPRRAWQDHFGLLFGAGELLAGAERVLKLSVSKWTEFARESSDGTDLNRRSIVMEQHLTDRPLFYMRRWYTIIGLNQALERIGKAIGADAFAAQEYVIHKTQGLVEAFNEYLVRELNALATLPFIAKVAARAQLGPSE